jgi:Fic family protein
MIVFLLFIIYCKSDSHHTQTSKHGESGGSNSGGSRAGLFRTPISGGVHTATSVHDLPPPARAVRNLMEQVSDPNTVDS